MAVEQPADLLANFLADIQLAAVLFLTVAVAEIHHQMLRQVKFRQRFAQEAAISSAW